jgi:predicted transcriptional regulator
MKNNYLFGMSLSDSGNTLYVIKILEEYNQPIPQDFLAKLVNWNKTETKKHLISLAETGLIKLDGNNVELVVKKT